MAQTVAKRPRLQSTNHRQTCIQTSFPEEQGPQLRHLKETVRLVRLDRLAHLQRQGQLQQRTALARAGAEISVPLKMRRGGCLGAGSAEKTTLEGRTMSITTLVRRLGSGLPRISMHRTTETQWRLKLKLSVADTRTVCCQKIVQAPTLQHFQSVLHPLRTPTQMQCQ